MLVKAKEGLKVPREENFRRFITGPDAVEVPASTYYLRRVLDGDLVEVQAAPAPAETKSDPAPAEMSSPNPVPLTTKDEE